MAMEVVPVKLPPELKQAMIAQAGREGMSRSAFMREALMFYMERVFEEDGVGNGETEH